MLSRTDIFKILAKTLKLSFTVSNLVANLGISQNPFQAPAEAVYAGKGSICLFLNTLPGPGQSD